MYMNLPRRHMLAVFMSIAAVAALNTSALAEDIQVAPLLQQEPSVDERPIPRTVLNGQVKAETQVPTISDEPLNSLEPERALDLNDLLKAATRTQGFRMVIRGGQFSFFDLTPRKPKMSTEEFRRLEYGVIGLNAVVHLEGGGPTVTQVFPTCPAANAGIVQGDVIVKADNYVFQRGDGQRVLWNIVGGKAETPVDTTILRNGELITFHLIRMNMEDIQDTPIRRSFENLLSQLGPPRHQ